MFNQSGLSISSTGGGSSANVLGTLIQTQTLGAGAASVTFASIPQTYTTLKLFISSVSANAGILQLNFNSDSGTNYSNNRFVMNFSTGNTIGEFGDVAALLGSLNTNSGSFEITLSNYSSAQNPKTYFGLGMGATATFAGGVWANATAISQIVLTNSAGGNFAAGSVFSLYGIK